MATLEATSNFNLSEVVEAIRAIIETGSETPIAAILTVIILVSALGFFLFRQDVSHYRAFVFLVISAMAGFILFNLTIKSFHSDDLSQENLNEKSFEVNSEPDIDEDYLPAEIYGRKVYFGMSETQLRAVRDWLPENKLELKYRSFGGARIDESLLAIRTDIQVEGFNGIELTYAFNDAKLTAASSTFQCSIYDYCLTECREAEDILSRSFSPDKVLPNWQQYKSTEDRRSQYMVIERTSSIAERRAGNFIAYIIRYNDARYIRGTNSGTNSYDGFVSCGVRAYLFEDVLDKS